jgi:tetraacyldisaccharide 4'-kinase
MREPAFWRRDAGISRLLAPAAMVYRAVADTRLRRAGTRAGVPVLCVGNLTVGGAGKTPTALTLAKLLLARSQKPMFLTRGYGGTQAGPIEVQAGHAARDVGDEALILARLAPTIVARDRVAGAGLARARGAGVIIMDDGFQNPSLDKDFSLIVVDGEHGIGNGRVFPAGPLRASLGAQLKRMSAMLVVGSASLATREVMAQARGVGISVLTGQLVPDPQAAAALRGKKVLAFAGIGHPDKFFATLRANGIAVSLTRGYPDHHAFTAADANELLTAARTDNLTLVTTEKDIARMRGDDAVAAQGKASAVLTVKKAID